jgi:hypothetical protein
MVEQVYGCGAKNEIVYRPAKQNNDADVLSQRPYLTAPDEGIGEGEVQVSIVRSNDTLPELLSVNPTTQTPDDFGEEQSTMLEGWPATSQGQACATPMEVCTPTLYGMQRTALSAWWWEALSELRDPHSSQFQ